MTPVVVQRFPVEYSLRNRCLAESHCSRLLAALTFACRCRSLVVDEGEAYGFVGASKWFWSEGQPMALVEGLLLSMVLSLWLAAVGS